MAKPYEQRFLAAFDEHAEALFRHACFRISDREKAKDLTQDTFIKAWEYVRHGNEIREWKSFLYRVLNNAVIDEYRRKHDRSLDELLEHDPNHSSAQLSVDGKHETEDAIDDALLIERIVRELPKLPEHEQVVVTLRYIDGLTPKEIAHALDISENVASVRIHRGIEHLKKLCLPGITTPTP